MYAYSEAGLNPIWTMQANQSKVEKPNIFKYVHTYIKPRPSSFRINILSSSPMDPNHFEMALLDKYVI